MAKLQVTKRVTTYDLTLNSDERCILIAALRYKLVKLDKMTQMAEDDINKLLNTLLTES